MILRAGGRGSTWRSYSAVCLVAALLVAGCGNDGDGASGSGESVTVAIAQFADIPPILQAVEGFKAELEEQGYVEGENVTYVTKSAQNQTNNTNLVARQLVQDEPDMIYAIGTPLVVALAQQTQELPILFGAMTDPVDAGVVDSAQAPGGNLSGTSDAVPADFYFDLFEQVFPDLKTVGVLANPAEANSAAALDQFRGQAEERGIELEVAPVANTGAVVPALNSLRGNVDLVTFPADNTVLSALETVIETANDVDLPVIGTTADAAAAGGVAGIGANYRALGVINGRQAAEVLDGSAEISALPVSYPQETSIAVTVNEDAAREFGISMSQFPKDAVRAK